MSAVLGNTSGCQCPTAWWGVVPPPCPVHNPPGPTAVGAGVPFVGGNTLTYESCARCGGMHTSGFRCGPQPLSEADVERIARRVVEMLDARAPRRAVPPKIETRPVTDEDVKLFFPVSPRDNGIRHDEGEG